MSERIQFNTFAECDIRVGEIKEASPVPDTDKLVSLSVDIGEAEPRQIIAGIAPFFEDVSALVGTKCLILANLEPKTMRGLESNGMLLAAGEDASDFSLLGPHTPDIPNGTRVH